MFAPRFFCLLAALAALGMPRSLHAEDVSRTPPAIYASALAPHLTPVEKVLDAKPTVPADAEDGWVMLAETFHYITPDGKRLVVEHQIWKALTDAGAQQMGRTIRPFIRTRQKMHLVQARTIQPNGTRQDAKADATFIQSPQREADESLYHDSGELVIILPNVKAGSITEWIVVVEEHKPRIPGHFSTWLAFQQGWPATTLRTLVELPDDWAARLSMVSVGSGVPAMQPAVKQAGRTRMAWERKASPKMRPEPNRAPFEQTGPVIRLSTLKDWDQFLDWYVPLAEKSTALGDKLKAEVDELTKGATSPRQILDILTEKVADDVRYVGLEFGDSDLEPHPVAEIWEHQYGDCKDKASLLRAMLKHKGITSHLALINTEHLGLVDRRSPGVSDFNHVILLVEMPEGPVFCDPTISGAPAGMISPNDAEREVLLVKRPQQWMRTPAQSAGNYALDFDAKVAPTGEISGWATLKAGGYMGTAYEDSVKKSTRQQLMEFMRGRIERSYPGAEVADLKQTPTSAGGQFELAAYFVVPPSGAMTLRFPLDGGVLPAMGDAKQRETDLFLWKDSTSTNSVFTLPAGFRPASLPAPHVVDTPLARGSASWETTEKGLKATLRFEVKASRIAAADVRKLEQIISGLQAWMGQPLNLKAGAGPAPAAMESGSELADFPVMPTGEGQLALLQQRYPLTGNLQLRRAALEKTLQMFPKGQATRFNVMVQIAYLDVSERQYDAAIARLRGPLETLRGQVPVEDAALGDYVLGISLTEKGSSAEALAVFEKVARNTQVSSFRRAWCHQQRAYLLYKTDTRKAAEAVLSSIALEDGDFPGQYALLADLRLQHKEDIALAKDLKQLVEKRSPHSPTVLAALIGMSKDWALTRRDDATLLVATLEDVLRETQLGADFAADLAAARQHLESHGDLTRIQIMLKDWMSANPSEVPPAIIPSYLSTMEDFQGAVESVLRSPASLDQAHQLVRLHLEMLTRFEPGATFLPTLARAVMYADFQDRLDVRTAPPPVFEALLQFCSHTPPNSEPNLEGRFFRAELLTRSGQLEDAAGILLAASEDPQIDPSYRVTGIIRYSANCLARRDYASALSSWRRLSDYLDFDAAPRELLTAMFVALETNQPQEALWFLSQLRKVSREDVEKSDLAEQLQVLLASGADDARMSAWWKASAKWWPVWRDYENLHGGALPSRDITLPVIPGMQALGQEFISLGSSGKKQEAFEKVRLLAHAARWIPEYAGELVGLQPFLPQVGLGESLPAFRALTAAIYDGGKFEHSVAARRQIQLWTAATFLDAARPAQALLVIRNFNRDEAKVAPQEKNDTLSSIMARFWAMVGVQTGENLSEIEARLGQVLELDLEGDHRLKTVLALADIYLRQKRRVDMRSLLERELEHPRIKSSGASADTLRERLRTLTLLDVGDPYGQAVDAWLAVKSPSWLDYARPKDLSDPSVSDLDAVLNNRTSRFLPAELVKVCLLVARDSSQLEMHRTLALARLGWLTGEVAQSDSEALAWIVAILKEYRLPKEVRAQALDSFLRQAALTDARSRLLLILKEPSVQELESLLASYISNLRRYADLKSTDHAGAEKLAVDLLAEPVDHMSGHLFERLVSRLAFAGKGEVARSLYERFRAARFQDSFLKEQPALQLALLRGINRAKALVPVQEALLALYLKHRPAPQANPAGMFAYQEGRRPAHLSNEAMTAVREQWLKDGAWPRHHLGFWVELLTDLPSTTASRDLGLALLALALEKVPEEDDRVQWVLTCSEYLDTDDADTRQKLEALLSPYRNQAGQPVLADALRATELLTRLRIGAAVEPFAQMEAIRDPRIRDMVRWRVLSACVGNRDLAGLRRLVDQASPSELLSTAQVVRTWEAYRMLGKQEEAALAAESVRAIVYQSILESWMRPSSRGSWSAVYMATRLGEPQLIPDKFVQEVSSSLQISRLRLHLLCYEAIMKKQWDACARLSAEGRRLHPTNYDFYGHEGLALGHLGRKQEAIQSLKTYLQYTNNDADSLPAREMLDSLTK